MAGEDAFPEAGRRTNLSAADPVWQETENRNFCGMTQNTPNAECAGSYFNGPILRVAAYIRVSTENENQEDSFERQKDYFEGLLAQHPNWISAGMYADYGISGTTKEKRTGFNRLMRHCRDGRIDRIVTKSISRFCRNTRDFLKALEVLKEGGITILFEKENLDTAVLQSDMMLTAFGAVAQEESRSISVNIRWGLEKRRLRGETHNVCLYGYRYAEDGERYETTESGYRVRRLVICEEEAAVVRRIFAEAAEGRGFAEIAAGLNRDGIPAPKSCVARKLEALEETPVGRLNAGLDAGWTGRQIARIVQLERYAGDVRMAKTYTEDYKSHRTLVNRGERDQYYVKNHHPAIVGRELMERAQCARKRNGGAEFSDGGQQAAEEDLPAEGDPVENGNLSADGNPLPEGDLPAEEGLQIGEGLLTAGNLPAEERRGRSRAGGYPFSGRLVCACCGRYYHRRLYAAGPVWRCASASVASSGGKRVCRSETVPESRIALACCIAVYKRCRMPGFADPVGDAAGAGEETAFSAGAAFPAAGAFPAETTISAGAADATEAVPAFPAETTISTGAESGAPPSYYSVPDDRFLEKNGGPVRIMLNLLERIQRADSMEEDRSFLHGEIAGCRRNTEKIRRLLEELQKVRGERPPEEGAPPGREAWHGACGEAEEAGEADREGRTDPAVLPDPEERIAAARRRLLENERRLDRLEEQLGEMERDWESLEADYECRREAIAWMKTLPEGEEGVRLFLKGLTEKYVKAFFLYIEVISPFRYRVRWIDDVRTEVLLPSGEEAGREQGLQEESEITGHRRKRT